MTFLLLIRCTHKEFRVPSLCRPLVTYCFLTLEIKRYRTLTSFFLLKDADSIFSFNLQRNKGLFNFIQVKTSFSYERATTHLTVVFFFYRSFEQPDRQPSYELCYFSCFICFCSHRLTEWPTWRTRLIETCTFSFQRMISSTLRLIQYCRSEPFGK